MAYSLSPLLKPRFFVNSTNKPLVGGKLYTYLAETTTPLATYSDDAGTPNTNPIILDTNGECNLYLDDDKVYRLILKDANDVTYFDRDRVSSIGGGDYKALTFNTIADLRLKIGSEKEPGAQTSGYYAAGDGGGNSFYWDGTSSDDDNGGTIIKPTFVSGAGRWIAIDAKNVSIKQFGAYGDGLADDTDAIEEAINACSNVYIPMGVYRLTRTITLSANKSIFGDGWAVSANVVSTLKNGQSSTFLVDFDGPAFKYDGLAITTFIDNINIRDVAFYRNNKTGDTSSAAFYLTAVRACSFSNIYFYNTLKGMHFGGQSWQCEFDRVWTNSCGIGIESNASLEDSSLRNCVFRFGDIGFKQNYAGQTLAFYNCDLSRNRIGLLLNNGGTYQGHLELHACQFELDDGAAAGLWIESGSTLTPTATVQGCRFLSLETTPAAACIYVKNKAAVTTIRNTVTGCYDFFNVLSGAVANTKIIMINDQLDIVGTEVRNDNGAFVTKIMNNYVKIPTGSSNGIQIGSLAKFRVTDAGGYEVVMSDAIIARASDGELSLISASSKSIRMKPGGTQVAVFGATTSTLSNKVIASGLPTSSSGLSANELWVDVGAGNVVKRV